MPEPLCAGENPSIWQPDEIDNGYDENLAKSICDECKLKTQCLATAMEKEGSAPAQRRAGVWGGMTPTERHRLYKRLTRGDTRPIQRRQQNASLTEEEDQQRLTMYHTGMNDDQMAAELNCDRTAIRSWRHRRRLAAHTPESSSYHYWHLYNLGWESWEVCEARGIKMVTFQRWLQRNGLKPNPPRKAFQ
jgi:hypothetical protein